jgi:dipeptidyl aminopeptidase/acylaminoacyl peptidase
MQPLKAADADTWIVKKQSATEAPNYFLTHNFKNYSPLTNQQQKGYNGVTTELHSFKQLDGTVSQGVLYKPENFDPHKKYPVIISFYDFLSDQLYLYPTPEYLVCPLIDSDPAWMASHGYFVFTPDIYFTKDKYGPSTVNTIDGAAKYLSQLPYIDTKHMAACGHSNSGRFGYYLFTHSKSFAAMSLGSGFGGTDILSIALSIGGGKPGFDGDGESNLEWAETGAHGASLGSIWQNKQSWIDHIATLQADKATSPLLLFHNKKDGDDVMLAVQLFTALRRLNKKSWWLQYDNGYHTVGKLDAKDFTIRYTQYFDHYLKNAPAPMWMTQGIPYQYKAIESRYELDAQGNCGKDCPICKAWNEQYKRTPGMFTQPIAEWKLDDDLQKQMEKEQTKKYNENMKGEAERVKENNDKLKGWWKGEHY